MPRNKAFVKSGAPTGLRRVRGAGAGSASGGGGTGGGSTKKIVIKPFRKPPALPSQYYETTCQALLQGTTAYLQQQQAAGTSGSGTKNGTSGQQQQQQQQPQQMNFQNSYTSVVNLVSHQYGARLYKDLRASMQQAAALVLPETRSDAENCSLLTYVPAQYQVYTEYLLLCKHVFLPLDRTHYWQPGTGTVISARSNGVSTSNKDAAPQQQSQSTAASSGGANGTSTTNTGSATTSTCLQQPWQTIWQVGLQQFADRLRELGLDETLYKEWLEAILSDWNSDGDHNKYSSGAASGRPVAAAARQGDNVQYSLQQVWYLWQDLGQLRVLPLQQDLQAYWKRVSREWALESPYRATQFIQYAYAKWTAVHQWKPWLPTSWLAAIIEHCLVQPHLQNPELLLAERHLHPILEQQVCSNNGNNTTTPASPSTTSPSTSPRAGAAAHQVSPVHQLWMLAGRLPAGQQAVASAIANFARVQGLARVQPQQQQRRAASKPAASATPAANSTQVITDLLELQDCLRTLIFSLPAGTELIHLKAVWEEVMNVDTSRTAAVPTVTNCLAESLAKFLDSVLRNTKKMDQMQTRYGYNNNQYAQQQQQLNGGGGSNNANAATSSGDDLWLQKIISGLFVPLQAKDVFEAFYKKDLAKRLLWNRSVNMDVEKQVCSLLKAECGAGYTSKMEGMFQDVDWSRETMMVYKQITNRSSSSGGGSTDQRNTASGGSAAAPVEMEVQVLTTGYWPVYPQYPNLNLPDALKQPQEHFSTHYKTKYQGRRMTWQYALGHCVVLTTGFSKTYELVVGLCQALVLVQFANLECSFTLPQLQQAVGVQDRNDMERILLSLSLGKEGTRILRKKDYDAAQNKRKKIRNTVHDKDQFEIHAGFESNQRRIRINNIMMKETAQERNKTVEGVSRDRLYLMDAVLVRILKARKTILHQDLIAQVLEQVKVPAQAADVKKRIESLIEREYMERDGKDRNRYNYLA